MHFFCDEDSAILFVWNLDLMIWIQRQIELTIGHLKKCIPLN